MAHPWRRMRRIQATEVTSLGRPTAWTLAPIPGMARGLRSDRATTLHPHKPLGSPAYLDLLLCVFELRQGLDRFLGRAR
jgi:hypothetical protein